MLINEMKEFIKNTIEYYSISRKQKEDLDRAIRHSLGLVLFNTTSEPREYIKFARIDNSKFDNDLERLLGSEIVDYIDSLPTDGRYMTRDLKLEVVVAHIARMVLISTSLDMEFDVNKFRVVRSYINSNFRVKLRHTVILKTILTNLEVLLDMSIEECEIPDYIETSSLKALYRDLKESSEMSKLEFEKLRKLFLLFISKKANIPGHLKNDVHYGLIRTFMRVNHRVI